jgi:hypothetical protein
VSACRAVLAGVVAPLTVDTSLVLSHLLAQYLAVCLFHTGTKVTQMLSDT